MTNISCKPPHSAARASGFALQRYTAPAPLDAPRGIQIVPATIWHARRIELRSGDRAEIEALGLTAEEGLRLSLARALWADAYLIEGEVAAILGLGVPSMLGRVATPWLVTGRPVDRHRKAFLRLTRARLQEMRRGRELLVNHVHADYAQAVRWLAWLGFEITPARPFGPLGALFHQATMRGLP